MATATPPHLLNLPPPSATPCDSVPGTPGSCISTVAIKDGHEGVHPAAASATAERAARLSYFDICARSGGGDTPESTASGRAERERAKYLGPIAQGEGVVDTTMGSGTPVKQDREERK